MHGGREGAPRFSPAPKGVVLTVQGQIRRSESSQGGSLAHCSPAALFGLVKPEGASVRFSLNLSAVLQALSHEDLGWPDRDDVLAAIRCCTSRTSGNGLHQLGISHWHDGLSAAAPKAI